MGLSIYADTNPNNKFSLNGVNTSPMRFSIDGRVGGVIEKLYYVRNDSNTKTYTNVGLLFVPTTVLDIVNGVNGYAIKLKAGSAQPTSGEWSSIDAGNTIAMPNVLDTVTFHPFWLRVEIPKGAPVQTIVGTSAKISCTENAV